MEISDQIAGWVSGVVGSLAGVYFVWSVLRATRARAWPSVSGKILASGLDSDSDGFWVSVRYCYLVGDHQFSNDRVFFYCPTPVLRADAELELRSYSTGAAVQVYYDPENPSESVLVRSIPLWRHVFWLGFSIFFLVMAWMCLVAGVPTDG